MTSMMFNTMKHRARVAALARARGEGDADLAAARVDLEVAKVGAKLEDLVVHHTLTKEHRAALRALLEDRGAGG